jgi:hypothetical protein
VGEHRFRSEIREAEDILALQEYFFAQGWTDGLPVVPPVPERVGEFLDQSELRPDDVICIIPTRNRAITAEKVAINCVMAGCRPEYMPVVVAVLQAMAEPQYLFHASITSTGGAAPFVVVNGPIRNELGLNGGVNAFGPGNRANATIGRAVRLILINVAGARPGILDKSTQGHPGKFSFCIAELEEESPWEPYHVERGFHPSTSTVTVYAGESPHGIQNHESGEPEELLDCLAREIASIGGFTLGQSALVLSPEHAGVIAKSGWSKQQVKQYLFDNATQSLTDLRRFGKVGGDFPDRYDDPALERRLKEAGRPASEAAHYRNLARRAKAEDANNMKISRGFGPDDILMVVAGGAAGGHSAFIPSWSRERNSLFQIRAVERYCEVCEI